MYLEKKGLLLERGETTERSRTAGCEPVTKLLPQLIAVTMLILAPLAAALHKNHSRE
jgi:hypothetical protein